MEQFPQGKDFEKIISEREHQAGVVIAMALSWIASGLLIIGSFIYLC